MGLLYGVGYSGSADKQGQTGDPYSKHAESWNFNAITMHQTGW